MNYSDLQETVAKIPAEGNNSPNKQYLSEVDEGKRTRILGGEYLKDFQKLISNIDDLKNLTTTERNVLKADINSSVELKNLFIKNIGKTDELSNAWKNIVKYHSELKLDPSSINAFVNLKKKWIF